MRNRTLWLFVLALSLLATSLMGAAGDEKATNPCNPCGGKAMGKAANPCNPCGGKATLRAVNPCHAKMGTVFYVNDPMSRNTVSFTSEAPLEDIIGTTNQITGYVVFDPENPSKGGRGELVVPVASLKTGIPLRDEHLASTDWLAASDYPEIVFQIENVKDVEVVKQTKDFVTYEMKLAGPFTLHGKTRQVEMPARITYLTESEATRQKMAGNLLAGRASFEVSLKEFGIKGFDGVVGSKVGETIQVDISFLATDQMPDAGKAAQNPCNPCGGKKKSS